MSKGRKDDKLLRFAQALTEPNATAVSAAIAAGYPRGKNPKTFAANARKRANRPDVKELLKELRKPALDAVKERIVMSFEKICDRLQAVIEKQPSWTPEYPEWIAAVREYAKLREMYPKEELVNAGLFAGLSKGNVIFNVVFGRESDGDSTEGAGRGSDNPNALSLPAPI